MKIGIDLGGSHIGVGLIKDGELLSTVEKNLTRQDRVNIEETIIKEMERLINEILAKNNLALEKIEAIGIAAPGTISNGVIVKAGNLGIENFDIVNKLKERINKPIHIRNDAKCAGLAEKYYGVMKDYDDGVFLTIGTGIGGAVFINGKLLEPKRYSGFEIGHMVINKNGRKCSCGKLGCFESYASIKALKTKVTNTLDIDSDISGQYLRENLLILDNKNVQADVEQFLEDMKVGICNLIDIFEPEIIVLGGSFSYYEGNVILDRLIQKINVKSETFNGCPPKIVTAKLKNDAGIIGATIE